MKEAPLSLNANGNVKYRNLFSILWELNLDSSVLTGAFGSFLKCASSEF